MGEFVTVAKVGEIPEGQGGTFTVDDRLVAVFLHGGNYFAIDDLCPHMGASLGSGQLDCDGVVLCPWHAWRFRVTDGVWADNPRISVDTFDVRVVDDQIQVRVAAPPQSGGEAIPPAQPTRDDPPAGQEGPVGGGNSSAST